MADSDRTQRLLRLFGNELHGNPGAIALVRSVFADVEGAASSDQVPSLSITRAGADNSRAFSSLVSEVYTDEDFASLASQATWAKGQSARFLNTDRTTFSAAGSGWARIVLKAGVHTYSSVLSLTSCIGLVIEGEGMELTTLVFTGTSGDFLTLGTPMMVVLKNLTLVNGSTAVSGGKVQTSIYTVEGGSPQSTARCLVPTNSGGATKLKLENVAILGFDQQVVPTGGSNNDNFLSINGFYRWCNRHLVLNGAQSIVYKYLHTKFDNIYDAAIDLISGGHVHVDGAEVIIAGTFLRIAALADGQSACVLRNVHHEGYQNNDPTAKPKILDISGGAKGEVILANYEAMAAWDAASTCINVSGGLLNITARNSGFAALAAFTPPSYAVSQISQRYATFRQIQCINDIPPTSITKGVAAGDGSSRYTLSWEDCGNTVDQVITGSTGGKFNLKPKSYAYYRTGAGTLVRRVQASGGANPQSIASDVFFEKQIVKNAYFVGGSNASIAGTVTIGLYADSGFVTQIGTDLTVTHTGTVRKDDIPGVAAANQIGTQFWFKVNSSGGAQDVFGVVVIELVPIGLPNP